MNADETPRVVKNKDIEVLRRVYYAMQDVLSAERRRDWADGRLYSITQTLSDMPRGGGLPQGLDRGIAELDELRAEYAEELTSAVGELKEAQRILNGIGRKDMRTFVQMYYLDGVSGAEVRRELGMSKWMFDKIRQGIEDAEDMRAYKWPENILASPEKVVETTGPNL